jgi:hypothetical protein
VLPCHLLVSKQALQLKKILILFRLSVYQLILPSVTGITWRTCSCGGVDELFNATICSIRASIISNHTTLSQNNMTNVKYATLRSA